MKKLTLILVLIASAINIICAQDVEPLIKTHWNQIAPYNNLCPKDSTGRRMMAGCGPIAMAQVVNYLGVRNDSLQLSRNRYQIDSRSAVSDSAEKKGSRLEFYDKNEFMKIIIGKYKLALNAELKNVAANDYKEFFSDNCTDNDFYPTLYDELAYGITEQLAKLYRYTRSNLDDSFFCSADDFTKMEIPDSDENTEMASLYFMQQIMKQNQTSSSAYAFTDFIICCARPSRNTGTAST